MNYRQEIDKLYSDKLNNLLDNVLPSYAKQFFIAHDENFSVKTKFAYAKDLKQFLEYIKSRNPIYKDKELKDIPISLFEELTPMDIEEYLYDISYYEKGGKEYENQSASKQRKLATLRSFYKYYHKNNLINNNPAASAENPKVEEKDIIAMNSDEVRSFLDAVDTGEGLNGKQKAYHKKNRERDLTIYTLLLGTGIRISEMVGLNVKDIDIEHKEFRVIRKGGKEELIHFGEDVAIRLEYYIDNVRKTYLNIENENDALFLSLRGSRLSVRQIEEMTVRYAELSVPAKHITPHKMRSTFGSFIYNETGDAGLVASMLGHSSVDITMKRYAKLDSKRKKEAADLASALWEE